VTPDELDRLTVFLAMPSVSAIVQHAPDLGRAAEWCAGEVRRAGGSAEVRPGAVHPLVVGEIPPSSGQADAPTVLIYGHYDVQPVGEPGEWASPPFEPTVRDGRLCARGACDDKGCLAMLLFAAQRLAAAGRLGVRVRVLIDGEEESGGSSAEDWVAADPGLSGAAAAVIFDGPLIGPESPAFYVGVRGLVYLRVTVRTAALDAHSGLYGGAAMNAAHVLLRVIHTALPKDGRVPSELLTGVEPPSDAERAVWASLPAGADVLGAAGLAPADASAAEEFYLRTTGTASFDVHGLECGDPSAAATIIPSVARATVSLRLAPGQDGAVMAPLLEQLLRNAAPPGADVDVERMGVAQPALIDAAHPAIKAAAEAVERAIGLRPAPVRIGGSLPIVSALARRGLPVILSGFYLPDDGIHSPNEGISLDHLGMGARAAEAILESLSSA
jgi:acetylornithine deacetylase/succinyl-diaminopimelate desuccinylase-like protein